MQVISDQRAFEAALRGSYVPTVTVDAWYDGRLVAADLPIGSGKVTVDGTRSTAGSVTVNSGSPDVSLVPTRWDSALAPYGSQLHVRSGVRYGSGATQTVSLGWYRIDNSDPNERWVAYGPPEDRRWTCQNAEVTVQGSDRMSLVDDARFLSPEAPASTASVLDEIRRLVQDIVPVTDLALVVDAPIPASITYQTSRVQAVQALADVLDAVARLDPDGALELIPKSATGSPVWTVEVDPDRGDIVSWGRTLNRTDLYNGVISSGTTAEGVPVQASAIEVNGPLRWGGPFGQVPYAHSSPLITTATAAQADAQTRLSRLIRERVAPVRVMCAPNPALEWNDVVGLQLPDRLLTGPVRSIEWPLPVGPMTMVVLVPRDQLWGP